MNTALKTTLATLAFGVVAAIFASDVRAGCGDLPTPASAAMPAAWSVRSPGFAPARLMNVGYSTVSDDRDGASIVGLWKFSFTAQGNVGAGAPPNGLVLDTGFVTWHSDGTELTNSGKPPITSSFCMGVWKQVGHSTYKLNHWALSWTADGATFIGPTNIREEVTINRGATHYVGSFTIDQFDPAGAPIATMPRVSGTVSAVRITAD